MISIKTDGETVVLTSDGGEERLTIDEAERVVIRLRAAWHSAADARWVRQVRERREAEIARAQAEYPDGWMSQDEHGKPRWVAIQDGRIRGATSHFSITRADLNTCPRRLLVRVHGGRVAHIVHPGKGILCNVWMTAEQIAPDGLKLCAECARREGQREAGPLFGVAS